MSSSSKSFAVVFPGQGSQTVGMMSSFAESAVVRSTFTEASDVLGEDLWRMVEEGPAEVLSQTVNTQPVMLTCGVAIWRAWIEAGGALPSLVAGHSLGEYAALVAAGALRFSDAVSLVRFRAHAMQQAVPAGQGAMAAVLGLEPEAISKVCEDAAQGEIVSAANLNSPGQIVIAGHAGAVARAMEAAKAAGAKRAVLLPVSAPFHCELMKPAADQLAKRLADVVVSEPTVSVVNNVDVAVETAADAIRDALVRQAYSPVRWIETVHAMQSRGVETVFEFGPGKVLAGLVKRTASSLVAEPVADASALDRLAAEHQKA